MRICHSLQILSWQVLVVSGFSRCRQRKGCTVRLRLAYTWRHRTWRCCMPRPQVLLHSDHSPMSQLAQERESARGTDHLQPVEESTAPRAGSHRTMSTVTGGPHPRAQLNACLRAIGLREAT